MLPGLLRESLPEHAILPGGTHHGVGPTILVVDNDPQMLEMLVCYFEKRGFQVAAGRSLADAKAFFHRRKSWSLIMSDYHLPDGTGLELISWVRGQAHGTPVLLMSGSANCAKLCAGIDYLAKPFPLQALENRVHALLRR